MIAFREARSSDEDAVSALVARFSSPAVIDPAVLQQTWKKKIGEVDSHIVVAESDGRVVGYVSAYVHATLYADKPVAWIDEIFVSEDARNLGIGRGLMAEIDRWARGRGCRLIALASRDAGEFYKALGYSEDESRNYKRDPSG